MVMDWTECLNNRIVKSTKIDKNLISSTKNVAKLKIEFAEALPEHLFIGKIILLYDALREYLECIALESRYKIYNHECYSAFLNEIINLSNESRLFDKLRKIRNSINYYDKDIEKSEAEKIIFDLNYLINKFESY